MRNLSVAALASANWLAHRMSVEQVSSLGSMMSHKLGAGTKRNARALANLSAALPETSQTDREAIVRSMWDNFGRTIAETLLIERIAADPARVSLANPELLDECRGDGRGMVFVGLHFGNWEVMALPLPHHGVTPMCVYKPLRDNKVNAWLQRHRERLCPGGLFPASRATMLRLARHVRAGGSICIAGDHRDSNGLEVPFFGRPAPSLALPAMLAVRHGTHLFTVRVDRLPNTRFSVVLERIAVADTGDVAADTFTTTAAIQAGFEAWIKADPGRWLWFYKRWAAMDELELRKQGNSDRRQQDYSDTLQSNQSNARGDTPL